MQQIINNLRKYRILLFVVLITFLSIKNVTYGWYSCQQIDPSTPYCSPGTKGVIYQTCDHTRWECQLGLSQSYLCEYSGEGR